MPQHTFILNGQRVTVDCPDDVRLLWVIKDLLGVHGPKYGCAGGVCRACTCHINGRAFTPCSVPVAQIKPNDKVKFDADEKLAARRSLPLALGRMPKSEPFGGRAPGAPMPWHDTASALVRFCAPFWTEVTSLKMGSIART